MKITSIFIVIVFIVAAIICTNTHDVSVILNVAIISFLCIVIACISIVVTIINNKKE